MICEVKKGLANLDDAHSGHQRRLYIALLLSTDKSAIYIALDFRFQKGVMKKDIMTGVPTLSKNRKFRQTRSTIHQCPRLDKS